MRWGVIQSGGFRVLVVVTILTLVRIPSAARQKPVLREPRPQRAVGVVYEPKHERSVNYTQTDLPDRFDALLFIERTHALRPLR